MIERDFFQPGRSVSLAENGMVATSHPASSLAALDILREGGNAIDAAVCAVAVQGVVDAHMTGIGGDCFALVAEAGKAPWCLNGSGRTPAAAVLGHYLDRGLDRIGEESPDSVTVPGAVDAWCTLVDEHGRLGMERVLRPAIEAAENGFLITPRVAYDWARYSARISRQPEARAAYLPDGKAAQVGARLTHPALGETLRRIGREGRKAFYEGEVAADIVATLRHLGGLHSEQDFAECRARADTPISALYRDHELLECPPNGQGLAALIIVRILDGFDLSGTRLSEAERIHLLAEATKIAYSIRDSVIGDPETNSHDIDRLLSEPNIAPMRTGISMDRASPTARWDAPVHRDTVYVSVVDRDRNCVSLINSLFNPFGSGIYAARSGVLLQNRGSSFRVIEGHPNAIGPRKRPLHTIIPGMLRREGRPVMSFGVMGGQYQATGHAHFLSQILDRGFDPQMASDAPRSFYFDGELGLEPTIGAATKKRLEEMGHVAKWADRPLGGCQAIWLDERRGILLGASDHRKDGIAIGY